MPYFYAKTDTTFLWHPYAHLELSENLETLTIYVNDFYSQSLAGKQEENQSSLLSSFIHYTVGHTTRLSNDITPSLISDEQRLNRFSEKDIIRTLICLTEYPIQIPANRADYFEPNPWPIIDSLNINQLELVKALKHQYPQLKYIKASPEPNLSLFCFFKENSPLLKALETNGISITNQVHLTYSKDKTNIFKPN